jgi:arsenate reductase
MKKILFVCIGNSCRSQMAEGFARALGSDVMVAGSAGLAPAPGVARQTAAVMKEKGVDLADHFPKDLKLFDLKNFDLLVNLSGVELKGVPVTVETWPVVDPIGASDKVYREVREEIEGRVQGLVTRLRDLA